MGYLENWLLGITTLLVLIIFLYSGFEVVRRLLARTALRLCQMRRSSEGGLICGLKRKLDVHASKSILPRLLMMGVSFAILVFIVLRHSPKL